MYISIIAYTFGHDLPFFSCRPLYSSETEDFPVQARKNWRDAVEDLIYENNVDFYMSGHVHAYERLYPIYNAEVDPNLYNNPRGINS